MDGWRVMGKVESNEDIAMELWKKGVRKTPECNCPSCGLRMNAGACPDDRESLPGPGDVVVCLRWAK